MKYTGWLVALAIVTLALAGDPTCPSDLNGDGNVATADLLQLYDLGGGLIMVGGSDWGPCPSASVVATTYLDDNNNAVVYRVWTDGTVERNVWQAGNLWDGWETWRDTTLVPSPAPVPRGASVIDLESVKQNPFGGNITLFMSFSDGSLAYTILDCAGWCDWETQGP